MEDLKLRFLTSSIVDARVRNCPKRVRIRLRSHHPPPRAEDTEHRAGHNFDRRMPQKFAQTRFADRMPLEKFIDDLVEDVRLNACRTANASGIIHHDDCQQKGDGKERRRNTFLYSNCSRQCADRRRVGRWHPARADEQSQIDAPLAHILDDRLGNLRDQPRHKNSLEDPVGE